MVVVPVAHLVPMLRVKVAANPEGSQTEGAYIRVLSTGSFLVFVESRGVVVGLVVVVVAVVVFLNVVLCVV